MAGDDHAATAGGLGFFDAVFDAETLFVADGFEAGTVVVVADAAEVDDRVGWEDVLQISVISFSHCE